MKDNQRPNILFFFTDQQRWDTCGCYGQELETTPNLDRMAAEGVKFEYAFSCQPVCGPARATLQTGKYPTELGCNVNHRLLPINEPTIAKYLSESGYEVGYIGKWHLASYGPIGGANDFRVRAVPDERRGGYKDFWLASDTLEFTSHGYDGYMFDSDGFKREFPEGRFRADAQTDWLLEYIETRDLDKPFFMFCSYIEPHHQNDRNTYEGPHGSKDKFGKYNVPGDLEGTEGDWRENFPDYLGCINSLDENLGRVMDKLEEKGLADNTIIIFTSDHGSHFRTRNGEYKRSCHDGCIRIPMVIRGPGFEGGKTIEDIASLINLPPTIMEAAGCGVPEGMRERPLQDIVNGAPSDWQKEAFLQISESQCGRAIRTRKWTYSVYAPDKKGSDPDSEVYVEQYLYDNEADPHQRNNLVESGEHAEIRKELKERLIKRMVAAGEKAPEIKPAA
ncbi:MAG: sulfatase-like hydrolase/transferase [Planctomycetes bacterium]|nr:sulfatase-like hydrolase/transferase [Planctomycetota bacterium]